MPLPSFPSLFAAVLVALPLAASQAQQPPAKSAPPPPLSEALEVQVRLDRAGFSPGESDGVLGATAERAIGAMKKAGKWVEPGGTEALITRVLTPDDVAGPFTESIPADLAEQAKLTALNYTSPLEALAERYHSSPALLQKLNPGARFAAGEAVKLPNVMLRDVDKAATPTANVTIVVSKSASSLTVLDEAGGVMFHAPVTSGSEHDPLPLGKWTVTAVSRNPTFHYNPELFWDANPAHAKAKIPPGPNNPVGVVWIDLSREHYGIHGTPEPGKVGHTQSHGCVRLTNWDAAYVASLVKKGTPVLFER